ncbi:reticulon protein [Toxoplasma gondii TgCatPRC2]|uniref:Reticulon-like protein n=1 Tax=Toxoplasma gondii TgCatPRC2 TaxID=1130821 RepID=A0A151HJ55_TOXGO|nr:reticulon protein [Toxoplasma gondii TgCatPRC2]
MSKISAGSSSPTREYECAVARLLSWENPTTAGSLFLGINLLYFFVFVLGKSLLSVSCYFLMVPFAAGFLFRVLDLAPSFGEGPVEIVSRSTVSGMVGRCYENVNCVLESVRDVLLWKDAMYTAKCCVLTWAVGYVSSFFSMCFLVFCVVWIAFGFSFVKKMCAAPVCACVSPYIQEAQEFCSRMVAAIPRMDSVTK